MDILSTLSESEKSELLEAIPAITVLVAGADDEIDDEESAWAAKLTKIRSFSNNEELHGFYEQVGDSFETNLDSIIKSAGNSPQERTKHISEKLKLINPILAKLDDKIAYLIYKDLLSFAKHVARASGGFLRFGSISKAEKAVISLDMLDKVEYEEEEESQDF